MSMLMPEQLSPDALNILRMYSEYTYSMSQDPKNRAVQQLVDVGLLEWVPSTGWNSHREHALTAAGRRFMQTHNLWRQNK